MAGCPRCSRDLVAVNAHKPAVTKPNGFRTFRDLRVGEKLNLPDSWFDGTLDRMPASYFAALPHHDGVTAGVGALGDPASDAVAALALVDDRTFSMGVGPAATLLDQSVSQADGSTNPGIAAYAQATHLATNSARQHNQDLQAAIDAGNQQAITAARQNVQADLTAAAASAGLALQAIYGGPAAPPAIPNTVLPPLVIPGNIPSLSGAAAAVAAAIGLDPNFCASVSQSGTAVNVAVHNFKMAWNAANPGNPVPINTGTYDAATAAVLSQVLGVAAPLACQTPPRVMPPPGVMPPQTVGMSTGEIVGMSLLGVGVVGGFVYFMTRPPVHVRRVSREHVRVRRVSA